MAHSTKDGEPSQSRQGSGRSRAPNWTDFLDSTFVNLMRQENDDGNCHNGTFSQETWKRITKLFNERTNLSFTFTNLKNRLKVLKKTFNLYYSLANRSGWGWDPVLKLPTCGDDHMWEEIISVNKDYARIKGKSFPVYDDIDILFSRNIASGRRGETSANPEVMTDNDTSDDEVERINLEDIDAWPPSRRVAGLSFSSSSHFDHLFDDVSPTRPSTCASTPTTDASVDPGLSTSSGKRKRSSTVTPSARKMRSTSEAGDAILELVEQGKRRLEIANEILRREQLARPTVYSIDECMRKLESLPGITPKCIVAVGDCLKIEINRWFLMHYEGSVLETWLKRQMADFYHLPPSAGGPSGSFAAAPRLFVPQFHGVHHGGPSVSVPPNMHASSRDGQTPFTEPLFSPINDCNSSQAPSHSPSVSVKESVCTTPASTTHDIFFSYTRWT